MRDTSLLSHFKQFLKLGLSIFVVLGLISIQSSCKSSSKSKGYNYEQHRKDNNERVKETRKRNKKSKSLLEHKGKSVKTPKPEYP
ncbi:MAG: hypothetical protein FJX95_10045 [Bacteroidetes bacterium]|nr:hypothetical protein [Bacteroidota bacterium]